MCQIIFKSMHKCRSYSLDKLNLWSFYHLTFKCDLDLQLTWTNVSNGTSTPQGEQLCDIILKSSNKCRARDTRQNHWTMKYRSQWPTNSMRSFTVSDWTSIQSMMPSFLIRLEIQRKINEQWNIGHSDLQKIWGHSQCETEQVPKIWCLTIR